MKLKHFDDENLDDLCRSNNGYFLSDSGNTGDDDDKEEFKGEEYDFLYKATEPDIDFQSQFPDDNINHEGTKAEEEDTD
jgi:hypothetical protein